MTQGNGPGIVFNDRGPVEFNSLEESRGAPNPLALPALPQRQSAPVDPMAEFDAEMAAHQEKYDIDQAVLEAQHTKGETGYIQAVRGALSALLSPGAIGGMTLETIGKVGGVLADPLLPDDVEARTGLSPAKLIGAKALEDFGRSLGQASTGRSALEATAALNELFGGGGADEATSAADMARIAVDEQERAWPLLSTISQAGGGLAFGLATGAGAKDALAIGAKGLAAMGALEGAGAGAQAAYDVDAPLTEVWTSAMLGAGLGAGLGAAPAAVGKVIEKVKGSGALAKVFGEGETLGEFGENRIASSLGFTKQHYKKYGPEKISQVARAVDEAHLADGTPVFPKNVLDAARMDRAEIADRLVQAHDELGKEIGALRARASQWIDEAMPELRPSPRDMAARIRAEVAEPLLTSASEAERLAGRYVMKTADNLDELGDSISLEQFVQQRSALGRETKFNMATPEPQTEAMIKAYGMINDDLAARFARAAEGMGEAPLFRPLNQKYHLYEVALDGLDNGLAMAHGNNKLGLSSNIVMAGTFAGDIASGGAFSALKALGAGVGHKLLMEKGPQVLATLARRFARTKVAVDVADVGGREAQDAVTQIMRAKKFIQETADKAGPNPNVGAVAGNTAEDVATAELIRLSGGFDPTTWQSATRAPSPLARVLYRSPILDTVSTDLAGTVERTAALRPGLDFDIDAGRLKRLTKDADGPQAIGLVQQRVRELADNYTPIAQGIDEAMGQVPADVMQAARLMPAFEQSLTRLETAGVAEAMAEAHNLSRLLTASGADADGRSLALMLGGDEFGSAGKLYQQLTAPPSDTLRELADPAKLRKALQTLELRGELSQQITAENVATLAAYEARKKLTGEALPEGLKREMQAIEDLWSRGEEAVTLDGTRLGRIVDQLDSTPDAQVAAKVPRVPEPQQVMETTKQAVEKVKPSLLRKTLGRAARGAGVGVTKGLGRLSQKERYAQYETRLENLSQAVVQPDAENQAVALEQAPAGVRAAAAQGMNQKLQTLAQDMPKPRSDIHGTAYDSLSSEDIRRGTAMWEATMEPLSVFDDFARGNLDPDKAAYAWKQYPGLQRVAQLGVLDMLQSQLTPEQRSSVPDAVLTQLDFMLGFNGGLQGTVSVEFSQRMSAAWETMQQESATPPPPNRGLQLPTSKPTMTQRVAGAQ